MVPEQNRGTLNNIIITLYNNINYLITNRFKTRKTALKLTLDRSILACFQPRRQEKKDVNTSFKSSFQILQTSFLLYNIYYTQYVGMSENIDTNGRYFCSFVVVFKAWAFK